MVVVTKTGSGMAQFIQNRLGCRSVNSIETGIAAGVGGGEGILVITKAQRKLLSRANGTCRLLLQHFSRRSKCRCRHFLSPVFSCSFLPRFQCLHPFFNCPFVVDVILYNAFFSKSLISSYFFSMAFFSHTYS